MHRSKEKFIKGTQWLVLEGVWKTTLSIVYSMHTI